MALPDRASNVLPALVDEPGLRLGHIVFVTYSLGGLVVKETLRLAQTKAPHDRVTAHFLRRVRRVVFIGTPHFGSDQATLANLFSALTRPRETLAGLSSNDPHLRGLNTWFRSYSVTNNIEMLVLRETKPMPFLGICGLGGVIVNANSADPGLSPNTSIIPVDEDHVSICSPRDRNADVYKRILAFVSPPIETAHADILLADKIDAQTDVIEGVRSDVKAARDQISATHELLLVSLDTRAAGAANPVVSAEAERRLWLLRKSRFITGFDSELECTRLFLAVQQGELSGTSEEIKRKVYAWCARVLAAFDLSAAEAMFIEAQKLGGGDENEIAWAFFLTFRNKDKAAAWAKLSTLNTPEARSAGFLIAAHQEEPAVALKWLEDAGLTTSDLDGDGKLAVIQRRTQIDQWAEALADVDNLADQDFETTPALLHFAAMSNLAQVIHPELRAAAVLHLPSDLGDFPLATDAESMAYRRKARVLYERAAKALADLGQRRAAGMAKDYALWLDLRDPDISAAARSQLEASMGDPRERLRRLPIAMEFGLNLDLATVEREIDRETTLSGGKSLEAAIARFALARAQKDPAEIASYIARHRAQLKEYYDPGFISSIEVEVLARSGQIAEARSMLALLENGAAPPRAVTTMQRVIDEAAGADPILVREEQYAATGSLPDLVNLVELLKSRSAFAKLVTFGKTLFEQTRDLPHAELYATALYKMGQNADIIRLGQVYSEFVTVSDTVAMFVAWANYWQGDLAKAKVLLDRLMALREHPNDRYLSMSIAIASGDWSTLGIFVESEWAHRGGREATELLRAGQLAQRIGVAARSRDLIREAAAKANGDPAVLLGCYSAATSAGWENDTSVHEWLSVAIKASGEDGPIRRVDLRELLAMQPAWNERENRTRDALLGGNMPMFVAARILNRTLLDLYLVPALLNLDELDPRRRGIIFSFSGNRPFGKIAGKRIALDVTAILTLALLGLLKRVIENFETIFIAHTTLSWLFEERERIQFHQPSRVKDALEIKRLLDSGYLTRVESSVSSPELEHEVGDDLAGFLTVASAAVDGDSAQRMVIRPFPLHKPGTLMDKLADTKGYEGHLAGCQDIVAALKKLGRLTAVEEEQATSYLTLYEKPWPHNPTIEPGASLFLDRLAVTYLQHIALLDKLKPAGFTVYISSSEIDDGDALVRYEAYGNEAQRLIEEVRAALASGIASGNIRLGSLTKDGDGEGLILA